MHDIKIIRDDTDAFIAGLKRRPDYSTTATKIVTDVVKRDAVLRDLQTILQKSQARRNEASKEIGQARASNNADLAQSLMAEVSVIKQTIQEAEHKEREYKKELDGILAELPNIPASDVPQGTSEDDNTPIATRAYGRAVGMNAPKDHVELGEALGMLDFERAVRISGSRFVYVKGALARLNRALASFMLDSHTTTFGYEEVVPPMLVKNQAMFGTGQLPKFEDDLFPTKLLRSEIAAEPALNVTREFLASNTASSAVSGVVLDTLLKPSFLDHAQTPLALLQSYIEQLQTAKSQLANVTTQPQKPMSAKNLIRELSSNPDYFETLWLIPTAEVSLTNYVSGEILAESELPLRFTAFTPCFRAEAGAAGKDTRGMIRMHQFDKVELVSITTPEQSNAEHERMTDAAQEILKKLDLHHRVVTLCTGDMGFAARKTYDIEVWLPGQNRFREISSCSNCGDFQARRMNARYRGGDGKVKGPVHTLNGSGLAIGRTLIAILENYQNPDGSIAVPDALRPYMNGLERIAK